ncbi:MAG: metallophosphoesterase [Myxococcales bacterium]|nr:metallophosphoesterase [Myxococcales bacterium]
MNRLRILALAVFWTSGCLDVAEHRANVDARVGQAESEGAKISVVGGRAAVRNFRPGHLHLWAGAPDLRFTLASEADAGADWELFVENTMPGAQLEVEYEGQAVEATQTEQAAPTKQRWAFTLPAAGRAELHLGVTDAQDETPFRYAIFADVQDAIDDVQDIYGRINDDPSIRFAVMSGDLTEQGESGQLERFQRELAELAVPCFTTLGNHELGIADDRYHRYFGRGSHHFSFHGAHFTLLDSASATLAPRVYAWLDDWLQQGNDAFHSVYMHIPPLDARGIRNGAFASRAEANMLLGRLARAGVDITVYGHVHSYYAYSNAGIPAYITGGGGAIPERLDNMGRHFLTVDVDPTTQLFQTGIVRVD